jgi:hypothetical protein
MKTILLSLLTASIAAKAGNVTSTWRNAANGDWRTIANWSNAPAISAYPANGTSQSGSLTYDVNFSVTGAPYNVTLNTPLSLDSVTLNSADANVTHTTSEVRILNGLTLNAGAWTLHGGTLKDTVINQNGGSLRFGNSVSKLDNCTVNGNLEFPGVSNMVLLKEGTSFTGDANLTGSHTILGLEGTQALSGARAVVLGGQSSTLSAEGENALLMLGNQFTVRGRGLIDSGRMIAGSTGATVMNHGTILGNVDGLPLTIEPANFINLGVVESHSGGGVIIKAAQWTNQPGGTIRANGGTLKFDGQWNNQGALQMTNAAVHLAGSFNTAGMGLSQWNRTGGTLEVSGAWDNTDQTTTLNAATGDIILKGGTVTGGTIVESGARLAFTSQTSVLDGVRCEGGLIFDKVSDRVRLIDGAEFTGDAQMIANHAVLGFGSGTVSGGKTIHMDGQSGTISLDDDEPVLTFASGLTVRGRGTIRAGGLIVTTGGWLDNHGLIRADISGQILKMDMPAFINRGTAEARDGGTFTLNSAHSVNHGTLRAVDAKLRLDGDWKNEGVLELTNSTLELASSFTTADLGLAGWNRTGGSVDIVGQWDNTGSTLALTPATGNFMLRNGTVTGGSITQSGGARLAFHSAGGTLTGVAISGDLVLDKVSDRVLLNGGTTFTGNAVLSGNHTLLGMEGVNVISGAQTISLDGTSASLAVEGMNSELTLGVNAVLRGRGAVRNGAFITGGNGHLKNMGRLTSDLDGQILKVELPHFTNVGIAEAVNGATLQLTSPQWINLGLLRATGANLNLDDAWTNVGLISLTNARLRLGGSFSTAGMNLSGWSRSGGTVELTGNLDNTGATLFLHSGTGDIRLQNGTITGGAIIPGDQRIVFTSHGGTLRDLVWQGDLHFDEVSAGVELENSSFTGDAHFNATNGRLSFLGTSTVSGVKTLNLNASGSTVSIEGNDAVLTLDPNVIVRGRGYLNRGQVVTSNNARIVNRGVIRADIPAGILRIIPDITQEGTLEATTGTLELPLGFAQNTGTLRATSGTLAFNGDNGATNVAVNGGMLQGFGEVKPVSSLNPLTLHLGDAVLSVLRGNGGLNVRGDLVPSAQTIMSFDIGARTAGSGYSTLTEAGTGALVLDGSLHVTLVNGFDASVTAADTFTILASNQPLGGEFTNVAPGTRLSTADGHGSFRVNYGASSAFGTTTVVLSDFQRSAPAGFAAWAASFGLTGNQALPAADPDSDGISNLVEYAFALTPVQPGGFQYLPTLDRDTAGRAVITFSLPEQLPADVVCDVEASADLLAWQIISSSSNGTWSGGGSTPPNGRNVVRITDTAAGTRRFLRVKVRLVD